MAGRQGHVHVVARVPDIVWAPLTAAVLMALAGGLGLALGMPLLFPSLGPTAYLQAHQTRSPSSGLWATLVGHGLGIVVGYALVLAASPPASTALFKLHDLTTERVWLSVAAVGLTLLLQLPLKAYHPPAAATTLLITLGGFRVTWYDAAAIVLGVVVVALAGEALRVARERALPPDKPFGPGGYPVSPY